MIVGWTGHRPDLFLDPAKVHAELDVLADTFRSAQAFVTGGQRGVDTWAAQAGIRLGIPLYLILPLSPAAFAADWAPGDRRALDVLVDAATEVRIADGYSDRNRLVASSADLLVAVWTGTVGGGTDETLDFARNAGTPIRELRFQASVNAVSAQGHGI